MYLDNFTSNIFKQNDLEMLEVSIKFMDNYVP